MAKRKLDSLLEYARANGMSDADLHALHTMFWRIWAYPDLIGFPLVAESLRQVGLLAKRMWNDQLSNFGIERWPFLLEWLGANWSTIVSETGIDEGIKKIGADNKNPMKNRGFGLHAVYSALCLTHTDRAYEEKYRLLQGHILLAFSMALGELSSLQTYQEVCHAGRDLSQKGLRNMEANGEGPLGMVETTQVRYRSKGAPKAIANVGNRGSFVGDAMDREFH